MSSDLSIDEILDSIECLHTIQIEDEKYDSEFNNNN